MRLDWDEIVRHAEFSPRLAGTYVLDNSGQDQDFRRHRPDLRSHSDFPDRPPLCRCVAQDTFFSVNPNCTTTRDASPRPALSPPLSPQTRTRSMFRASSTGASRLEKKLPAAIYLKAEYLQRRGSRGFVYDTRNDTPAAISSSKTPATTTTTHSRSPCAATSAKPTWLMGSYTRSSAHSNQALDFNVDSPILSSQQPGPYPWDTPNRFLSWGYFPLFKLADHPSTRSRLLRRSPHRIPLQPAQSAAATHQPARRRAISRLRLALISNSKSASIFFGYYLAVRGGFDNITGRCDPFVVNNVIDPVSHPEPTFSACQGRAFTSRIRLLGRK